MATLIVRFKFSWKLALGRGPYICCIILTNTALLLACIKSKQEALSKRGHPLSTQNKLCRVEVIIARNRPRKSCKLPIGLETLPQAKLEFACEASSRGVSSFGLNLR